MTLIRCNFVLRRIDRWSYISPIQTRWASSYQRLLSGVFNRDTRSEIEDYWKPLIEKQDEIQSRSSSGEKYYVLSMFPYPSGRLHMGHVRVYTISDAMARFQRMHGKKVIHPMGWDAFGLPAENAAIERGIPPDEWTKSNIEHMRSQLKKMCYSFDWNREFATCDPEYYKWTQHIFLQMFSKGLVYRSASLVNWDPVDGTVLADEQIDGEGRSWRSGARVERRFLKQWYIKTTALAESLLDGLNELNTDLWRDVIKLQRNWIGKCTGTKLHFKVKDSLGSVLDESIVVFTERPELMYGISHITLSTHHHLNQDAYKTDHGDRLTVSAINPLTGDGIPLIIVEDLTPDTPAKLGLPCVEPADMELASRHGLPVVEVIGEDGRLLNSGAWSGLPAEEGRQVALQHARDNCYGGHVTSARLNDWLISRQRYWGTPIPIIHCPDCGTVPVPYKDLPVTLPSVTSLSGKGESPLAADSEWNRVSCPKCSGEARRETDTMDTFVDSSWYFLRYLDPLNRTEPFSVDAANDMPVDLYIGGKEHATLHLYFARFFSHFLHSEGLLPCREPFYNLLTQGMVLGQSYRVKETGKYLTGDQVRITDGGIVETMSGEVVVSQWEKMSKSKHNGVDPEEVLAQHGVESTRLCILGCVAPKSDRKWQPEFFKGILNWQSRLWSLVSDYIKASKHIHRKQDGAVIDFEAYEHNLFSRRNYFLSEYLFHMEKTFLISTCVSFLQVFTNELKKVPVEAMVDSVEFSRCVSLLVMMVAPLSPMFASELWSGLQQIHNKTNDRDWSRGVLEQRWPPMDPDYQFPIPVKSGREELFTVTIAYKDVHSLTNDRILDLVRNHSEFTDHDILSLRPNFIVPGVKVEVMANIRREKKEKKKKKL